MKFLIVLSAMLAVAFARPGVLLAPHLATLPNRVVYTKLAPGAPIGLDGRVVDTPEVALAKAEHAAAYINEKFTLANEVVKNAHHFFSQQSPALGGGPVLGAPLGFDGRAIDTPEVAYTKAKHAAAYLNVKLEHSGRSTLDQPTVLSPYSSPIFHKVFY